MDRELLDFDVEKEGERKGKGGEGEESKFHRKVGIGNFMEIANLYKAASQV